MWTPRPQEFTSHEDHGTVMLNDEMIDLTDIISKFQPVGIQVENYESKRAIIEEMSMPVYKWRDTLPDLYHGYRVNSYISAYYKVWACNQLKKVREESIGKYDMVIMARPDLIVSPLSSTIELSLDTVHINYSPDLLKGWIWNILFVTNSINADIISDVFPKYPYIFIDAKQNHIPHRFFEPHNLLHRHIFETHQLPIQDDLSCQIVR
jgi:hypothetical protein